MGGAASEIRPSVECEERGAASEMRPSVHITRSVLSGMADSPVHVSESRLMRRMWLPIDRSGLSESSSDSMESDDSMDPPLSFNVMFFKSEISVAHSGECRTGLWIKRYSCQLTLDPNTAHRGLSLSEGNRKVTHGAQEQPYPNHPERFDNISYQVLCRESLTSQSYWEVEWGGSAAWIGVTYKGIQRKGGSDDCRLGANDKSWVLSCYHSSYSVWHKNEQIPILIEPSSSRRVGVYLDWGAGALSFYRVSSDGLTLLCRVTSSFTEPLCPGFGINRNCSVSLCMLG